jgi:hypothetical protein
MTKKKIKDRKGELKMNNELLSMLDYIENTKGKNSISQNELIKIKHIFKK